MMATGYVHPVMNGEVTTLRDFALMCARAMGALVSMRDQPHDAPIPDQIPLDTSYHDERLAEATAALKRLVNLTDEETEAEAAADLAAALERHVSYVADEAERMRRCKAMLSEVEGWTTEAEGIRDFMLQQLRTSIGDGRPYEPDAPVRKAGDVWRQDKMAEASREIAYHRIEIEKEVARTADRNRWLTALRASLPLRSSGEGR